MGIINNSIMPRGLGRSYQADASSNRPITDSINAIGNTPSYGVPFRDGAPRRGPGSRILRRRDLRLGAQIHLQQEQRDARQIAAFIQADCRAEKCQLPGSKHAFAAALLGVVSGASRIVTAAATSTLAMSRDTVAPYAVAASEASPAGGVPIASVSTPVLTPASRPALATEQPVPQHRIKRRAEADARQQYIDTIAATCEIDSAQSIGDYMLIASGHFSNPVRGVCQLLATSELSELHDEITDFVNGGMDVVFGFYTWGGFPAIKYTLAKLLEYAGHRMNGNQVCASHSVSLDQLLQLVAEIEFEDGQVARQVGHARSGLEKKWVASRLGEGELDRIQKSWFATKGKLEINP